MALVKINGTNLMRDTTSMAVLPIDNSEKAEYYNKLRVIKTQKDEINNIRTEITSIKTDMDDIKNLLVKLLEKG